MWRHRTPCFTKPSVRFLASQSKDNKTDGHFQGSDSVTNLSERVLAAHNKLCTDVPFMPPDVPVYCCMSGCPNCVYLQYAVEMAECFGDNGVTALKVIDAIEDETLKAFLRMEVQMLFPELKQ